ncbi:MAG: hypothetical protein AAF639_20210 [Chloroflexota bacterium]
MDRAFHPTQMVQQLRQDTRLLTQQATFGVNEYQPVVQGYRSQDASQTHTLDALFDQSWQLLSANEQHSLVMLAQFAAPFDLTAAQAIVGLNMFDLKGLTDTSLLTIKTVGRYEMHPLTRTFLQGKGQTEIQDPAATMHTFWHRYCTHFLTLVADYAPLLNKARAREAMTLLRQEQDHIHLAWQQAIDQNLLPPLQTALDGLVLFYNRRAAFDALFTACQQLRDLCERNQKQDADVESAYALLLFHANLVEMETKWILQQLGDAFTQAESIKDLLNRVEGKVSSGLEFRYYLLYVFMLRVMGNTEQFHAYAPILHRKLSEDVPLSVRGDYNDLFLRQAFMAGDMEEGERYAEEALSCYRQDDNLWGINMIYLIMSHSPQRHRNKTYLDEALANSRVLNYREGEALSNGWLAKNLSRKQQTQRIAKLKTALTIYAEEGNATAAYMPMVDLNHENIRIGAYGEARKMLTDMMAQEGVRGYADAYYVTQSQLGLLEFLCGHPEKALPLTQGAMDLHDQVGATSHLLGWVAHGYALLGNNEFEQARAIFEKVYAAIHPQDNPFAEIIPQTALAEIAHAQGHRATALAHVEWILPHLADDPDDDDRREGLEQIVDQFRPHWVCYQVLVAMGDARADDVLQSSYAQLQAWADGIEDRVLRRSFLENVAVNRMIVEAVES